MSTHNARTESLVKIISSTGRSKLCKEFMYGLNRKIERLKSSYEMMPNNLDKAMKNYSKTQ